MDIEEATKEADLAVAADDMPEKKAAGLGNMAESTLVFDPVTSEIVWTADVGEDDVVLRDKVSHNCSGVLISLDPHTRNPAPAYNPAVNIAEWKPQAAEGDFVISRNVSAETSGFIVMRKRTTPAPKVAAPKEVTEKPARGVKRPRKPKEAATTSTAGDGATASATASKKTIQLNVRDKGIVKRAYIQKVLLVCIDALKISDIYTSHTQPCGLTKLAYTGGGADVRVFPTLVDAVEHIKTTVMVNIPEELSTNPERLFGAVLEMNESIFTKTESTPAAAAQE